MDLTKLKKNDRMILYHVIAEPKDIDAQCILNSSLRALFYDDRDAAMEWGKYLANISMGELLITVRKSRFSLTGTKILEEVTF